MLGRLETAEVLLERGADINRRPKRSLGTSTQTCTDKCYTKHVHFGRPPLITAAAAGHVEMVRLLLERGADPGVADEQGRLASEIARAAGFMDVLGQLAKAST